jgi:cytochrome c
MLLISRNIFSIALLSLFSMLIACSDSPPVDGKVISRGKSLIEEYGCPTCHKTNEKIIGPSYKEVAQRYKKEKSQNLARLANAIVQGGAGNWGEIPMTPHPHISREEAETMVHYILSL